MWELLIMCGFDPKVQRIIENYAPYKEKKICKNAQKY